MHCTTPEHSIQSTIVQKHQADLPQLLTDIGKEQRDGMCSTSLDMDSWILCSKELPGLLDVACPVEEHTIDTSTQGIKLLDPWVKQRCHKRGILLSTIDEMFCTYNKRTNKKEEWLASFHKQKTHRTTKVLTIDNRQDGTWLSNTRRKDVH